MLPCMLCYVALSVRSLLLSVVFPIPGREITPLDKAHAEQSIFQLPLAPVMHVVLSDILSEHMQKWENYRLVILLFSLPRFLAALVIAVMLRQLRVVLLRPG